VILDQSLKLTLRQHVAQRPPNPLRKLLAKAPNLIAQTFFW